MNMRLIEMKEILQFS